MQHLRPHAAPHCFVSPVLPLQRCFTQAAPAQPNAWQHHVLLGSLTTKLQQPGWQAAALKHYATACHLSKAGPTGPNSQPASLQPLVKLHGLRLKLLAAIMGPTAAANPSSAASAAASLVEKGSSVGVGGAEAAGGVGASGSLAGLLQLLEPLAAWCFDVSTATRLQRELLPQLRQQLVMPAAAAAANITPQQELFRQLCEALQTQWQRQDTAVSAQAGPVVECISAQGSGSPKVLSEGGPGGRLALWQEAVSLVAEDSISALSFCNAACTRPLGPACYSLARGLCMLGR